VAVLVPVLAGWWIGNSSTLSSSGDNLIAIGRLMGLLAAFSILIEVILISRLPFIEKRFDLHEINDLHRLNGYLVLAFFVSHIVFLVAGYAAPFKLGLIDQFLNMNKDSLNVLLATIGSVIFIFVIGLSIKIMRKRLPYEIWYLSHLLIYGAILLTFLHQITDGRDFITQPWFKLYWILLFLFVFGTLLIYRFLRPLYNFYRFRFSIHRIVSEAEGIYSVLITGKNVDKFRFEAGQYATFWFIAKSSWWEGHAYSLSSVPGENYLRITIKTSGDFAKKVPFFKPGTKIIIDGPRGSFLASRSHSSNVILIAGGIGIAPYMSTIQSLINSGKNVTLYYAAHDKSQIAFMGELAKLQRQGLRIKLFDSSKANRIDFSTLQSCSKKDTDIFICGPNKMTEQFCSNLADCGLCKKNIIAERFSI
jgi:predicted ferric reductase